MVKMVKTVLLYLHNSDASKIKGLLLKKIDIRAKYAQINVRWREVCGRQRTPPGKSRSQLSYRVVGTKSNPDSHIAMGTNLPPQRHPNGR